MKSRAKPIAPLQLELCNRSRARMPKKFLQWWVAQMTTQFAQHISPTSRFAGRSLTIAFVDRREMQRLNKQFRQKDRPTDVLSFGASDAGFADQSDRGAPLGELAIAPEVIKRQAKEHGLLFREELGYMVLHGFLHLLGYDHETSERDARVMFKLQDQLFEEILAAQKVKR